MTAQQAAEAAAIVVRFAAAVLGSVTAGAGRTGAELRRACGALAAGAEGLVRSGAARAPMQAAADLARQSGASLVTMGRVRLAMLAEAPVGLPAVAVVQSGIRLSLAQEARIVGATTWRSRQEIDAAFDRINAAFEAAELSAADDLDAASYRAIVALHAAVSRHLADASRPLPRMVDYATPATRPALDLARRLYGDARRAGELIAENRVVHPAFMPRAGRALAV